MTLEFYSLIKKIIFRPENVDDMFFGFGENFNFF